jgi:hypothetical protein
VKACFLELDSGLVVRRLKLSNDLESFMPTKFESPHAELQALLPWFAVLAGPRPSRPAFRTIAEAASFKEAKSMQGVIQPIWAINHEDLLGSEVAGYTIIGRAN